MWSSKRTSIVTVLTALGIWASVMRVTKARIHTVKPGGLQEALDVVTPGDTIEMVPGNYFETVTTKIDGEFDNYITIQGATYGAILKGNRDNGGERIFNIEHSYYRLDHFTIDGELDENYFFDKCIYVHATEWETESPREIHFNGHSFRSSINGLVISNMNIRNCGDECVRLRYFITYAQIYNNVIENCGINDYVLYTAGGKKNGEGIYVGTSSEQWHDGKNPTAEADESRFNHIFKNRFNTQGNEGVDIKEGSSNNIVEDNYCTGQRDPNSACLDARGSSNIFRFNTIEYNNGTGIRFGGHTVNDYTYGVDNEAYGNEIFQNDYGGVKIMVQPQGAICENNIEGLSPETVGDASEGTIPTAPCRRTRASVDSVATLKSNSKNSPDTGDDDDDSRNHPEINMQGTDRSEYHTNEYLPVYDHLYQRDFETPSI